MSLQQVPAGRNFPDDINVIIEVPSPGTFRRHQVLQGNTGQTQLLIRLCPELVGGVPDSPLYRIC